MCGLFGCYVPEGLDESGIAAARAARDCIRHRGPDQEGEYIYSGLYMGHRRLSILDLSESGRQPMWDTANQVAITVNGEIYNHQALREELERAGYVFRSTSDSEMALYGYSHWGLDELCRRIDGMYIMVIYDQKRSQLHAVRDRSGIKPLYYFYDGHRFGWASELKALTNWLSGESLPVDESALLDFLTYRFIPAPKSIYKQIRKLEAGHLLTLELPDSTLHVRRYWSLPVGEREGSHEAMAVELVQLLEASVKEQLMGDVPLGFLLSGGIDSSAVTMLGARFANPALAFSISFAQQGRDETEFARQVAELAGAIHHTHEFPDELLGTLRTQMGDWFDEPFGDTSALPTHLVSRFARQHVTVALSGDGGDELFGGYKWYERYANEMNRSGTPLLARLAGRPRHFADVKDPVELYARVRKALPADQLEAWRQRLQVPAGYDLYWAFRAHYDPGLPARKAAQVIDFHTYLPDDILTKVDRTSMQVALECRPPFLSRSLIEFAFSLPESFIYKDGELKGGLKWALRDILPASILQRGKQGFSIPDDGWKRELVQKYGSLQEAFLEPVLKNMA